MLQIFLGGFKIGKKNNVFNNPYTLFILHTFVIWSYLECICFIECETGKNILELLGFII